MSSTNTQLCRTNKYDITLCEVLIVSYRRQKGRFIHVLVCDQLFVVLAKYLMNHYTDFINFNKWMLLNHNLLESTTNIKLSLTWLLDRILDEGGINIQILRETKVTDGLERDGDNLQQLLKQQTHPPPLFKLAQYHLSDFIK